MVKSNLFRHFIDFLFPPFCLHCDASLKFPSKALCPFCLEQIEWGAPKKDPSLPFKCFSSTLINEGPSQTLTHGFLTNRHPQFVDLCATLMLLHLANLNWPFPHQIVYKKGSLWKRWRGNDPQKNLAKAISHRLKIKAVPIKSRQLREGISLLVTPSMTKHAKEIKRGQQPGEKLYGLSLF